MKEHESKAREPMIAPARGHLTLVLQRFERCCPSQKALSEM